MCAPWSWVVRDARFTTGATIPYVLGALRLHRGAEEVAPEDVSRAQLHDLLMAMRDDVIAPDCIAIQKCSHIQAPVAAWKLTSPEGRVRIPSPFYADRAMYSVNSIEGRPVHDFESLFAALWSIHKDDILVVSTED
jgi:hypothetical protein